MKSILAALAVAALLASCASKPPPDPPRVVAFGDSLTDAGTYAAHVNGRTAGKFTTNPGPLWLEDVAQALGTSIGPHRHAGWGATPVILGGTDYAEGSARISQPRVPMDPAHPGSQTAMPVRDQVSVFLAERGSFERRDIVFFWAGANDVFVNAFALKQTPAQGEAAMRQAARELAGEVRRVLAAGAGQVVVLTIEDYGDAPATLGSDKRPMLSAWTRAFHSELTAGLSGLDGVTLVDAGGLLREVRRDPAKYKLKNVTDPACNLKALPEEDTMFCDSSTLVAPDAARTYLYADDVHLTSAGQQIVADAVLKALGKGSMSSRP
jgi:outer membrane lipase/esterase